MRQAEMDIAEAKRRLEVDIQTWVSVKNRGFLGRGGGIRRFRRCRRKYRC